MVQVTGMTMGIITTIEVMLLDVVMRPLADIPSAPLH